MSSLLTTCTAVTVNNQDISVGAARNCATTDTMPPSGIWRDEDIDQELQLLANMHRMDQRQNQSQTRNKLQPRHVEEFSSDSLFDQFARVICQVSVIPRKELFETWAMALYVHTIFPKAQRIVDLACSHGLLSWALLLLAHHHDDVDDNDNNTKQSRSAVCIDLKMPKSADKVATVMLQQWPCFQDSWDYVEAPLEAALPDSSTLLVGIHACGLLSDKIITHAIQGNASLALIPCCHTKQSLSYEQRQNDYDGKTSEDDNTKNNDNGKTNVSDSRITKIYSLANIIDQHRINRLQGAGFHVFEATIPSVFTPKNKIIFATPSGTTAMVEGSHPKVHVQPSPLPLTYDSSCSNSNNNNKTKSNLAWATPKFCISLADTPSARAQVRKMAGRIAAIERKQDPPRSLHVSLLLPPHNTNLSAQDLQAALIPIAGTGAQIEAVCSEPFWHPTEQRFARTFKVTYRQGDTKKECKEMHQQFRETIPIMFPGAQVRY